MPVVSMMPVMSIIPIVAMIWVMCVVPVMIGMSSTKNGPCNYMIGIANLILLKITLIKSLVLFLIANAHLKWYNYYKTYAIRVAIWLLSLKGWAMMFGLIKKLFLKVNSIYFYLLEFQTLVIPTY